MLTRNEINRPMKASATVEDAYKRFLKVTGIDESLVKFYKIAAKPYLQDVGLPRTYYISNAIIVWLVNGEKLIYKFDKEVEK